MKYLIEHMEEVEEADEVGTKIGEWASLEYAHMEEIVGGKQLIFTNSPEETARDGCYATLDDALLDDKAGKPLHIKQSLSELLAGKGATSSSRVCLLDMQAEEALKPEDVEICDVVVFGGILGTVRDEEENMIYTGEENTGIEAEDSAKYTSDTGKVYWSDDRTKELMSKVEAEKKELFSFFGLLRYRQCFLFLVCWCRVSGYLPHLRH